MKNLINKRYREVRSVVNSLEEVDAMLVKITDEMNSLKQDNLGMWYAKQALTKGFAVDDVVSHPDYPVKYKVVAYVNGMFVGKPMSGRGTKQIALYDGWSRVSK